MKQIFLLLSFALTYISAFSWGQKGHDVIANIAEHHLSDDAKIAIDSILQGKSLVYYSNWLDNASHTPQFAYTKTWHYKNIDADQTYESAPNHKDGNIITGLHSQIDILKSTLSSLEQKTVALKMIVHLIGDLHQPMHMGHLSDLGGNKWYVKYFNKNRNIHSVWDSSLVESAHNWSYTEWTVQINRIKKDDIVKFQSGSIDDWGKETYEICKSVYDNTPVDYNISYDYIATWTPVIEQQFLKGGLRLAKILNEIFSNSEFNDNPAR